MTGFIAFALPLAFWPGFVGAASAPKWALLSLLVPLACGSLRLRLGPAHWVLLAWLAYAAASLAWAPGLFDAVGA